MTTQSNSDGPSGAIGSVQEEFGFMEHLERSVKTFTVSRKSLSDDLKRHAPTVCREVQTYLWPDSCSEF
jgi:hypothetical protein